MPEALVAPSVRDVIARASAALTEAGCETPRLDAELLLAEALAVNRARLVLDGDRAIPPDALRRFEALLARRSAREPVAYILGRKDFRRLTLSVDLRVLIPRPETELLVEVGLSLPHGARVVDVGTGSGAVALALNDERPDLEVWATDVSSEALDLARENASRLGLDARFELADLLVGIEQRFDVVLANLPYVAETEQLAPEISQYEPSAALLAGPDGLSLLRRLITMLSGVSTVALEVGFGQADPVARLVLAAGFASVECLSDLAGHDRVVVGSR